METNRNKLAVDALRKLFKDVHDNNYLREIWKLVGAMRGPDEDNEDEERKAGATTPIRMVFLNSEMASMLGVSDSEVYEEDLIDHKITISTLGSPYEHFNGHANMAERVINIAFHK